jgi:hypothetical protein
MLAVVPGVAFIESGLRSSVTEDVPRPRPQRSSFGSIRCEVSAPKLALMER